MAFDGNKAKIARRVIEVLEFFDDENRQATVMDIVRRYNRPQSSTSELFASLVELGLLYKDPRKRFYTLTPRAAFLGSLSQPSLVRDGRLSTLIDRLIAQSGLGVALMGVVGVNAQVFRWGAGSKFAPKQLGKLANGAQTRLCDSAAGWLLLSTIKSDNRERVIRRLNAEAPEDGKFNTSEMVRRVEDCGRQGWVVGPAGFGGSGEIAAALLPGQAGESPMALSFVYQPSDELDHQALIALLRASMQRCVDPPGRDFESRDRDGREAISSAAWSSDGPRLVDSGVDRQIA